MAGVIYQTLRGVAAQTRDVGSCAGGIRPRSFGGGCGGRGCRWLGGKTRWRAGGGSEKGVLGEGAHAKARRA
jgi:hypothetical protein